MEQRKCEWCQRPIMVMARKGDRVCSNKCAADLEWALAHPDEAAELWMNRIGNE